MAARAEGCRAEVGETWTSSLMAGERWRLTSSVLRRVGGPRREPAEDEWRSDGSAEEDKEEEDGSWGRGAVGGGGGGGMGVAGSGFGLMGGFGLTVAVERLLSVEAVEALEVEAADELVMELTRETASFLAIVTTKQGSDGPGGPFGGDGSRGDACES